MVAIDLMGQSTTSQGQTKTTVKTQKGTSTNVAANS